MPYFVYNIDITLLFFLSYLKILILNRKQFKQFTLHNTMKCSPYKNLTSNHRKTTNHVWKPDLNMRFLYLQQSIHRKNHIY